MSETVADRGKLGGWTKQLVSDANPNNDVGACGVLNGFLNGVSAGERSGQLSASQAAALRAGADAIGVKLGC